MITVDVPLLGKWFPSDVLERMPAIDQGFEEFETPQDWNPSWYFAHLQSTSGAFWLGVKISIKRIGPIYGKVWISYMGGTPPDIFIMVKLPVRGPGANACSGAACVYWGSSVGWGWKTLRTSETYKRTHTHICIIYIIYICTHTYIYIYIHSIYAYHTHAPKNIQFLGFHEVLLGSFNLMIFEEDQVW